MYRKILLAYDGSREGRCALRQGADLAVACGAAVHLLAVVSLPVGMMLAEAAEPANLAAREGEPLRAILAEGLARLHGRGLEATAELVWGNAVDEVAAAAREVAADLIVLGHRRRGRLARWWGSGSVGATILDHAPCSILVAVEEGEELA